MSDRTQARNSRRVGRWAALAVLIPTASIALPASASAAPCPVNPGDVTAWLGGSGDFGTEGAWSNGTPSGSCDTLITAGGSYTVTMTGGASMKSLTLGGPGSTPTLVISAQSPNTNLHATTTGIDIASGAAIVLTCPALPTGCLGGPTGGSGLNVGSSAIDNAGTITVDSDSGTGATLSGHINNTEAMDFEQSATHNNGTLLNQGDVDIADGKVLRSTTSHCGDSVGTVFKNDTGGTLDAAGTGTLDVINYEQGNGTTSGSNPVQMPCGSLKYTGNGAGKARAYGGFTLTGEMQAGQSLAVSSESSNTNAILGENFTNNGSITLTCPASPGECSGGPTGGAGFNVNDKDFTNAGTFTVAAASGTGASLGANFEGTVTNAGTIQFDQSAGLGGPVVNKGLIGIANGKTATSTTSSCGDTGGSVKNDTGGQINATGTGTLSAVNYEQGAGTTVGAAPVAVNCGYLKYTGAGASTVRVNSSASMTGGLASGQTLSIAGTVHAPPSFTNAGTIVFDQSLSNPTLNASGTLTNTGTVETNGASANTSSLGGGGTLDQTGPAAEVVIPVGTKLNIGGSPLLLKAGELSGGGTLTGSVNNSGGTLAPGASPGTLALSGNYTQGAGGSLEIEVEGTGAGQFDRLAVGGNATLGGTLALRPTPGFVAAAAPGDSVEFLTYGGARTDKFASTTVSPSPKCQDAFSTVYGDGAKKVSLVVANSGAICVDPNPAQPPPVPPVSLPDTPPSTPPNTVLGTHPKPNVKIRKAKAKARAKVKFAFSATIAGSTFQCKLDKKPFMPCASPKFFKVKPGRHKFSVRAVGPGGALDPTPASFSFKVVKKKARR